MALASASKSVYFMDNLPDYSFSRLQKILDVQKLYHRLKKEVFSVHEADAGTRFNVFDPAFTQQENKTSMLMKNYSGDLRTYNGSKYSELAGNISC